MSRNADCLILDETETLFEDLFSVIYGTTVNFTVFSSTRRISSSGNWGGGGGTIVLDGTS